ncbi:hypothetical protein [Sphingomonas sp. CFBP 13720]|uniref:hypothetical protein n=1 Tax=Sphingomonas sp. CFBP 13720 TaxID=2775302 RepID=UPI00177EC2D9|nr:hypothetical protein [Sphingomonas sp. CFBP 13720]MBD8678337.1 hypothetical protein [Sphingomonas sp. CFBP 13720]
MPRMTRRQSIATIIGGGVVGLAGLGFVGGRETGLIDSILRRVVGPYRMDDDQFTAFVADLATPQGAAARAKFALYRAVSVTDPDTLLRFAPTSIGDKYAMYERRVVTNFLTRTDYLTVGPTGTATFNGEAACRNPFAKLDAA